MFTGIITAVGKVAAAQTHGGHRRLFIETPARFLKKVMLGDSIACRGVCLTVAEKSGRRFAVDLSLETLSSTTAGDWKRGTAVNLEPALTLQQPLGGHLVSGHVDGLARLESRRAAGPCEAMVFSAPRELSRYIARKGSVCLDGVSLTVNRIKGLRFELMLVPHTLRSTTLGQLRPGDRVNLEVDLLARYLERLRK